MKNNTFHCGTCAFSAVQIIQRKDDDSDDDDDDYIELRNFRGLVFRADPGPLDDDILLDDYEKGLT